MLAVRFRFRLRRKGGCAGERFQEEQNGTKRILKGAKVSLWVWKGSQRKSKWSQKGDQKGANVSQRTSSNT